MKNYLLYTLVLSSFLFSCGKEKKTPKEAVVELNQNKAIEFENRGHELVYRMTQKVGDFKQLASKKDVTYTYTYQTPDGKFDISTEKYRFDGELSFGAYKKHDRTLANLSGVIKQGYDGSEYWLKHNGEVLLDTAYLKRIAFNRHTNFYWFTMMQKLMDPGLNYQYLKEQTIGDKEYHVVKVTFESDGVAKKDIYQLYINKKTNLVDQFLFTVADFGKMEPLLMKIEYETIEGILLPTKRMYKNSNWDAVLTDDPWILVNWSDIKFNTGLTLADFKK